MTSVAVPTARPRPVAPTNAAPAAGSWRRRLIIELAAFAALGGLGLLQWSRLVAEPPGGRLLLALAAACCAGGLLTMLGRSSLRAPLSTVAAIVIAIAGVAGALLAAGIPARLLLPPHWGELRSDLSLGFAGVEQAELPYRGDEQWLRLALLSVVPGVLAGAAALAFWPGRRRERRRLVALVLLLAAYAAAVTLDSPGAELLWGVVLLMLAAAWLWAPRLEARRGATAAVTVAAAGLLALPVASSLDPATPWWDYESWSWFGSEREVTFNWDHSYGPLEWPQDGTTLLEVHSDKPLYWKASVLDRFDGFTWQRARDSDIYAVREQRARSSVPGGHLPSRHQNWLTQASFEVRALSSPFVIATGTTQAIDGLEGASASGDGTVRKFGTPIEAGDEYSVVSYSPDPTVDQLRAAPSSYPSRLHRQVLLGLPLPGATAPDAARDVPVGSLNPVAGRAMPLWGSADPRARAAALASAYGGVYGLAHRVVAGARTPYDAVIAIQRYLHRNYTYNPDVPRASYPLQSFLFDQREGYCQQFSGSMALMLRMVGIPSRVVSGFAPGTFDAGNDRYEIHDTDAHSWVEVYFRGIGWVTFDPTPAAAPAVSQTLNELAAFRGPDSARGTGPVRLHGRGGGETQLPSLPATAEGGGPPWGAAGLGLLGLVGVTAVAFALVSWRRHRALARGGVADAQLEELLAALPRLGWGLPPQATLLALERRFDSAGRRPVAGYAATLRAHRYAPGGPAAPDAGARRALRRALSGGAGLRRRLRGLIAIPPGGPRTGSSG